MKELKFNYDGKSYTLAYSRESVRTMERTGFSLDNLSSMPVNMIPQLFYGAFAVHHRGIKRKLVDDIWESMEDKSTLITTLAEMYYGTIEDLLGEEDGEAEETTKKTSWVVE